MGTNDGIGNIERAKASLAELFSDIVVSPTIPTEPLGSSFQGSQFYNAIARCTTEMDSGTLIATLKDEERALGDRASLRQRGVVVLDLDLLKYDGQKFHDTDWERTYIKQLLKTIQTADTAKRKQHETSNNLNTALPWLRHGIRTNNNDTVSGEFPRLHTPD